LARFYFGLNVGLPFVAGGFEVELGLHADPVVRGGAEIAAQSQGGFSGDGSMASDNAGNAVGGDVERVRQPVHADAHIVNRLFQNFAGVNGRELGAYRFSGSAS